MILLRRQPCRRDDDRTALVAIQRHARFTASVPQDRHRQAVANHGEFGGIDSRGPERRGRGIGNADHAIDACDPGRVLAALPVIGDDVGQVLGANDPAMPAARPCLASAWPSQPIPAWTCSRSKPPVRSHCATASGSWSSRLIASPSRAARTQHSPAARSSGARQGHVVAVAPFPGQSQHVLADAGRLEAVGRKTDPRHHDP